MLIKLSNLILWPSKRLLIRLKSSALVEGAGEQELSKALYTNVMHEALISVSISVCVYKTYSHHELCEKISQAVAWRRKGSGLCLRGDEYHGQQWIVPTSSPPLPRPHPVCVHTKCACMLWYACLGQWPACRSWFSPTMWVLGIDFRLLGLRKVPLPKEPSHQP